MCMVLELTEHGQQTLVDAVGHGGAGGGEAARVSWHRRWLWRRSVRRRLLLRARKEAEVR